jgi:myo-inositol 2-dehydrogenase / D-chiro-inositol 1-dehydrogenase
MSASICHLNVIAMRLGREPNWDPKTELFVNDAEANRWLASEMRSPWGYDRV